VHKGQRHKFGDAAGAELQIPDGNEVARPVPWAIHVAKHDGGGCRQAHLMRNLYDLHKAAGKLKVVI
jgi:hypothetical protein